MKSLKVRIYNAKREQNSLVWEATLEDSDASIGEISNHFYGFARMFLRREAPSPYVSVEAI